jgi:hypothetical protein
MNMLTMMITAVAALAVALPAYAGDMLVSHGDCDLVIVAVSPAPARLPSSST